MKFIQVKDREPLEDLKFNIYKFTNRFRPKDKRNTTIISCLSEFGCETIGVLWNIPMICQERAGHYKIAVGWYGREYFYRHLVDEYWELKQDHQWLRDYCKAFHHESRNLSKLEMLLKQYGYVITTQQVGNYAVGNRCRGCGNFWGDINHVEICPRCNGQSINRALFGDIPYYRNCFTPIKSPSKKKREIAKQYLKPNTVGVFARGRKTYGRNLQPEFYKRLIILLQSMGYNIIWLGEKQSTLKCPVDDILDYSRMDVARDLELTCAIVKELEFTVQFWTASTRLSAIMGTPYLMFESPAQIWGDGQEGLRLSLLRDMAPKKMAICHFTKVLNDHDSALNLIERCVKEMNVGNYSDVVGLVESESFVKTMKLYGKKGVEDDRDSRIFK
jgi:hypothetical protein